jgi:hypothetical protein
MREKIVTMVSIYEYNGLWGLHRVIIDLIAWVFGLLETCVTLSWHFLAQVACTTLCQD